MSKLRSELGTLNGPYLLGSEPVANRPRIEHTRNERLMPRAPDWPTWHRCERNSSNRRTQVFPNTRLYPLAVFAITVRHSGSLATAPGPIGVPPPIRSLKSVSHAARIDPRPDRRNTNVKFF